MRYFYIGATATIKQRRKRMSWIEDEAEEAALDEAEEMIFEIIGDLIGVELEWEEFVSASNMFALWIML